MASLVHDLVAAGKKTRNVPVTISYRILELFSAGLYSSPNKAIEELVANSYDALAEKVHVVIPTNLEASDAVIWVIDDGESMDDDGIVDLWRIAASRKRDAGRDRTDRPPIGRFGIGKLATYVLASQLTYITKHGGKYRAITMDYSTVRADDDTEKIFALDLRSLTERQAEELLAPLTARTEKGFRKMPLFGPKAPKTWTVVALAQLKPMAHKLTAGRLKWVLSTALPLSPGFQLFYNGEIVASAKNDLKPLREWTLGLDDTTADTMKQSVEPKKSPPTVNIDGLGPVHGKAYIFEDPLTGGKAESWGRSHGVFVMVRGRLINLDDALFGLPALSHGPFSRFRMEVHADALDHLLRSSRETVLENSGVQQLRKYLLGKFNEARSHYDQWLAAKDKAERITTRLDQTPQSLSRKPLISAIRAVLEGKSRPLMLTKLPKRLSDEEKIALVEKLETSLESEEGFIQAVNFAPLGIHLPLARFEAATGQVFVNSLHPFYANYSEMFHSAEPFELLAIAEILTEAYLIEEDVDQDAVRVVLRKRDRFLRELVYSRQLAAPLVAELLRDNADHSTGLELAVAAGLRSLGFEVSPIGGNGEPDGTALARLGVRDEETGRRSDYVITYDAKSTSAQRVSAHTIGAAGIQRHRETYRAQFSLVVARDFDGANDPEAAANVEARRHDITLMRIEDFANLVLAAATRQLGFTRLRKLFETCRTPEETRAWINSVAHEEPHTGPLNDIIDAIWDLQRDSVDPVRFAAVSQDKRLKGTRQKDIKEWMQTARRLAGGYITIEDDVVALEAPPQKILREVNAQVRKLPPAFRPSELEDEDEDD